MTRSFLLTLCLLLMTACATGGARSSAASAGDPVLDRVVRELCDREVAALGETAAHGDGKTIEFKAALVERLVQECGFDAVFFEASSYDFLELERRRRRGEPVTRELVASAVGGLWNRYVETQRLIDFLHQRAATGRLRLGGLDDQLGSAGAFYSIAAMPAELSGLLPEPRGGQCREQFRKAIYGETPPFPAERAPLIRCVAEIRAAVERGVGNDRVEKLHMIANIERYLVREWTDEAAHYQARDRSMWLNYQWLRARLPRGARIILWSATTHLARDANSYPPYTGGANFGEYLHRLHGGRLFVLGFAAAGGSFSSGGTPGRIEPAAAGSLEAAALSRGGETAYLNAPALRRLGFRAASIFAHDPVMTDWSRVVDGVVVFREERPPQLVPRP